MEELTYNARGWIDRPTQRVDGDNVRCLLVPGPIFPPVACRDFFPGVVKVDCLLEVFHFDRVPVSRLWFWRGGIFFLCVSRSTNYLWRGDRKCGLSMVECSRWWAVCVGDELSRCRGVLLVKMSVKAKASAGQG